MSCLYTRARELCRQVGETPQLFPLLLHFGTFCIMQEEYQTAGEIGQQLLDLAERANDSLRIAMAHFILGWPLAYLGKLTQARAHMDQAVALCDPQLQPAPSFLYGPSIGVLSLVPLFIILWSLGYPEQALKLGQKALKRAHESSHPHTQALALALVSVLHNHRRDAKAAQETSEACIRLATEHKLPLWLAVGSFCRGWALAEQGQTGGIDLMRQGLAGHTGTTVARTYRLVMLVGAYEKVGQTEPGLVLLDEALAVVDRTGERLYEAEIYRLKGELLLQREGNESEAQECFLQAIEVARQQQAKTWQLRATTSLARLWQRQGKQHKAQWMLAEIYDWFTEGFDTPDLKEAKALLEDLTCDVTT